MYSRLEESKFWYQPVMLVLGGRQRYFYVYMYSGNTVLKYAK